MTVLGEIKVNIPVKVTKIHTTGIFKRRIMDMGITKGAILNITKFAPFGDPMEILVRNYKLTIRKKDANLIEVEYIDRSE